MCHQFLSEMKMKEILKLFKAMASMVTATSAAMTAVMLVLCITCNVKLIINYASFPFFFVMRANNGTITFVHSFHSCVVIIRYLYLTTNFVIYDLCLFHSFIRSLVHLFILHVSFVLLSNILILLNFILSLRRAQLFLSLSQFLRSLSFDTVNFIYVLDISLVFIEFVLMIMLYNLHKLPLSFLVFIPFFQHTVSFLFNP